MIGGQGEHGGRRRLGRVPSFSRTT
jgi:hypothetical protein